MKISKAKTLWDSFDITEREEVLEDYLIETQRRLYLILSDWNELVVNDRKLLWWYMKKKSWLH